MLSLISYAVIATHGRTWEQWKNQLDKHDGSEDLKCLKSFGGSHIGVNRSIHYNSFFSGEIIFKISVYIQNKRTYEKLEMETCSHRNPLWVLIPDPCSFSLSLLCS